MVQSRSAWSEVVNEYRYILGNSQIPHGMHFKAAESRTVTTPAWHLAKPYATGAARIHC